MIGKEPYGILKTNFKHTDDSSEFNGRTLLFITALFIFIESIYNQNQGSYTLMTNVTMRF